MKEILIILYQHFQILFMLRFKTNIQLPSANPPPCLRCLAVWSNGWFIAWLLGANIHQIGAKIHQVVVQNPPKSRCWGLLGALGEVLGGSWAQDLKNVEFANKSYTSWGSSWSPKSIKIGPKSDPKSDHFFDRFEDRFLEGYCPTWSHLGPQNPPKMEPSWLQNRSKLGCWFESCFLMDVGTIFIGFRT